MCYGQTERQTDPLQAQIFKLICLLFSSWKFIHIEFEAQILSSITHPRPMDQQTHRLTDQWTDRPSCRDAWKHLKAVS